MANIILISLSFNSKEHQFLQDLIKCTDETAGGRLARWLQPEPYVDPRRCKLIQPVSARCGEEVKLTLLLYNQHGAAVYSDKLNVEMTAYRADAMQTEAADIPQQPSTYSVHPPPPLDFPYQVTVKENMRFQCISMMKAFQGYSLEELRIATPLGARPREVITVLNDESKFYDRQVTAVWVPMTYGRYSIQCTIDEYSIDEPLIVNVNEPLGGVLPSNPKVMEESPKPSKIRKFMEDDSSGLRIRAHPSLQSEQVGLIPTGCSITFDNVVTNADGVWLRLNSESSSSFCNYIPNDVEAWVLQYNHHLRKSLLQPSEPGYAKLYDVNKRSSNPYGEKLNTDQIDPSLDKFQIVRQADVRTSYKKDSPVIGVLEIHDIVYGKKTHTSMLETWVMLDERSVESYGYLSDTGECWVLRHSLETITHTGCSDTDESAELSDTDLRTQSRHYRVENTAHQKERMVSMKQKYKEKRKKDKKNYLRSTVPEDAENQIDDLSVYSDPTFREGGNGNASNSASAIPGYNKDIAVYFIDSTTNETESRVTQIGTQTSPENSVTSFENASSEPSSNTCQQSQVLPESPGTNRNKFPRKRTYSTDSNTTVLEENKLVLCGYGKSPSKAESFRAMFAAFMWHEGIVHDAMTCASYLKFYPSLPKQGSQVVTRHLPHSLATRQLQRHSVEVSNAGNYLNIQASTLESLTRSALNANANRARSKRTTSITNVDVAMIREEDGAGPSGECTVADRGDVVRVLPAAFRALLALWDAMSEMLPDPKYIDRNEALFNDKMPLEETGLPSNKSDKDDLSEIFFSVSSNGTYKESKKSIQRRKDPKLTEKNAASNKYLCELCCESVDFPVSEHMLRYHKGCGGPSSGLGYSYTGIYVGGWFGICGLPGHGYMGPGYVFCGTCRDKYLKNKKNKETTPYVVSCSLSTEQTETKLSQQSDQFGATTNYHFVIKRNAMFLLELASAAGTEKKSCNLTGNSDESQYLTPNTLWLPIPPYQCVEVLSQLQPATQSATPGLENLNNEYSPSSSNVLREDYQYREDDNLADIFPDCRPSTSAMGPRVQRSVSMGPDTTKELSHDVKRKMINQWNDPISNSSLLCQPSAALQALVGINSEEYYNSEVSSLTPLKVNKKLLMTRPAIGFLTKKKDIIKIKSNMINTVKIGAMRKYGLECMNWMIHSVTQPICLHDLMWWFSHAMNQYHTSVQFDDAQLQENANGEGPSNGNNVCGWKESMECLGSGMNAKLRQSLHALLQSISDLMPLLPPASPLLLQGVRCWALDFTAADHTFLHRSQVFNNISKILSHSEDDYNEDNLGSLINGQFAGLTVSLPDKREKVQVWGCRDITKWCEINVSSRQAMIESLTDGSTETFWESGEEDRTKPKWVQITIPLHLDDSPSLICLHIDNTRDNGNKILLISFLYGSNIEDLQHIKDYDATVKTNGWIFCSLPYVGYNPVIRCEVRGPDGSVRIRQIRVLGQPAPSPSYRPYPPIATLQHHTEVETLRVFRLITSQVFGKLINSDLDEHSDFQRSGVNNDLKEHMVGILFSRSKLTNLQKQVMIHIVTAISSEAKRARESWENTVYSDNQSPDLARAENAEANTPLSLGQRVDEYCFEMLSMVLALSGSHLGRAYLSEHLFLIRDLLSLLHTGSARVQRQVISVLRRMIGEVTPQRMTLALATGLPSSPSITFIDHLVSCISKALRVQIKIKMTGTGQTVQYVPPSSSLQVVEQVSNNKTAMYTVVMRSSLQDIHSSHWFLRGTMSHRHARLVSDLLSDMIQGKMSKAWAHTTKVAIAENIFTLTVLKDENRAPDTCIAMPNLWRALGSLCVLDEEQVERLSSSGWTDLANTFVNIENTIKTKEKPKQSIESRPFCVNHDDGETYAIMECQVCGKMCQECDRFLHLHRRTRSHQRQVCKEEESAIRVDLHEGCGRVKLFWLLALVDQRTLKSLVEFRSGTGNVQRTDSALAGWKGTSGISTGICRFCGAQSNIGLLAIGNVCADHECQEHSKDACVRILTCGHLCGGIAGEVCCLPCLHGCASNLPQSTVLMDEAAANSSITQLRPPLRQDAEDMCMICFTDPLSAAPAIQLKCGHVFHLHCAKKAVINKWVGPRITFSFSQCPICKEDMSHVALEDLLRPIRELQDEVKRKALVRLEYEGLKDAAAIATRYQNMASEYAMDRYAYYVCFKCQKAYYGGEARCDTEGGGPNVEFDPTELVCGGCSDVARAQMCPKHGADFLEYKCRFCCSVAVFFCLGDTHFCNGCHEEFQRLRKIPVAMLPQCPAGAKGKQLEGSRDDCPLRIRHPPTGTEFALGCGICRNSHTF